MFKIQYNIYKKKYSNLEYFDEMELRYDFLEGNAKFFSNNKVINLHENIPIFDLAVSLKLITKELNEKSNSKQTFDFTESGNEIIFTRSEDQLTITTKESEEIIRITYKEFTDAVEDFYSELLLSISNDYPELLHNKSYQKILKLTV